MNKEKFVFGDVQVVFHLFDESDELGDFEAWIPGMNSGLDGIYGTAESLSDHMVEMGRFTMASRCIREDGRDVAWIESLKVDPARRKAGLGSRILKSTLIALQARGIGQIWLSAAPDEPADRDALLRLYRRHGFDLVPEACRDRIGGGEPIDIMAASFQYE